MEIITKQQLLPLLQTILPHNPIIVEAGAFNGRDTLRLASQWPQGTVHAFEPVPEIFSILQRNTSHIPSILCYPYALSSTVGTALFYLSEKPSCPNEPFQAGSLHKPTGRLEWSSIRYPATTHVNTITLDAWAQDTNIGHIDLLWLDVQGHGLDVLKAAPLLLKNIAYLYLEIEFKSAYEGQPTYEAVLEWLACRSFDPIAKDFQTQEKWFYGNILFKNNLFMQQ